MGLEGAGAGFAMGVGRFLGGDGTGVMVTVLVDLLDEWFDELFELLELLEGSADCAACEADLFDEWYDELDEAILDCDAGDVCLLFGLRTGESEGMGELPFELGAGEDASGCG